MLSKIAATLSAERVKGRLDAWKLQQKLESKTPIQEQIQDKQRELIEVYRRLTKRSIILSQSRTIFLIITPSLLTKAQ